MPTYAFTARDAQGRSREGAIDAASTSGVVDDLRGRGWLVLDVHENRPSPPATDVLAGLSPGQWLPPRSLDVEMSLRQTAVMLRSGLTLLNALTTVAEQSTRASMGRIWSQVAGDIQEGSSLADAMGEHRRFSPLVVQLVRVGEQTGQLEPVLARAADSLENRRHLRTSLLTALAYPAIVLLAAVGVTAFMAFSVIPKLEKFLSTIGRKLPAVTQLLLDVTNAVHAYAVHAAVGTLVAIVGAILIYMWPPGRMAVDRLALRVPLIGRLFRLAGTIAFANGLCALLRSGITLLEGLRTVERLQRNRFLAEQVADARDAVMHGGTLASALYEPHAFMPLLGRMVAVGESAGTLDEVLDEIGRFYTAQLQSAIRQLSVIVEPMIIIVVGGIVGFVYTSFFMALFAAGGAS